MEGPVNNANSMDSLTLGQLKSVVNTQSKTRVSSIISCCSHTVLIEVFSNHTMIFDTKMKIPFSMN